VFGVRFNKGSLLEPYFDNRILGEKLNGAFLFELRGTPAEYSASLKRGLTESGTFVRFTQAGASCLTRILRRRLLNLFVEFHDAAS
jgi:hypothetical protein